MNLIQAFIDAEIALLTRQATTPTSTEFGIDLVCVDDLDPKLVETRDDSIESLAQDLYHRVTTPRGAVPDAGDFGEDLTAYASQALSPRDIQSIGGRVASECKKDDRVALCEVVVDQPDGPGSLRVTISVTPDDPRLVAFSLVIAVVDGLALLEAILKEG